jgi:hypothetical protein
MRKARVKAPPFNLLLLAKGAYPVGTVRNWNGRDWVKMTPDKWEMKKTGGKDAKKKAEIIENLGKMAVSMLDVEYKKEEYDNFFPQGEVKTPIKTVKMGSDQFAKLGRRDSGNRKSYIGAAYQTLTDPVAVIKEGNADVYIKSFIEKDGMATFLSVEKDQPDGRFVVTNYQRHKKEVINKIKRADSIVYVKDNRGNPARMDKEGVPHAKSSHTFTLSPDSGKKSSGGGAER